MSVDKNIEDCLKDLNSPRNFLVERFAYEIPSDLPMKICDVTLVETDRGGCVTEVIVEASNLKFRDYASGEMFRIKINTTFDPKSFFRRLHELLLHKGSIFMTLKASNELDNSCYSNTLPIYSFSHSHE